MDHRGRLIDRARPLRASVLACVILGLALSGSASAASGSATITNVTYEATQPSAPATCQVPPGLGGSGSESYATPDGARNSQWEWTIPATLTAGATAHIKVTSQAFNNGGSSDAIAIGTPQEFGLTPSSPNQVIASVPTGAPGTSSAEQSYTFHPTRDFVAGETFTVRIGFGCANFVYTYTASSSCGGRSDAWSERVAFACPLPGTLPLTPSTTPPQAGIMTSYAAPQDFRHPITVPGVAIRPNDVSATVDVAIARDSGNPLPATDFLAGVSDQNISKGITLCRIFVNASEAKVNPISFEVVNPDSFFDTYAKCVLLVARILQRAENLHAPMAIDATAGCSFRSARSKGARRAPKIRYTCSRTRTGVAITIRSTGRGRTLRSVLGSSPRLIIGRVRSATEPVLAGDRVNVRWTTSTR